MPSTLFVHSKTIRPDGSFDTLYTTECEAKDSPLWHHTQGLSYTASGYGRRIPTRQMVKFAGKWRRVYCCIYSNAGTCYIGKLHRGAGEVHIVN
jgi:hypothetical protein